MPKTDKDKAHEQDQSRADEQQGAEESAPTPEERIEELEAQLAEAQEQRRRALADFQNYQRRALVNEREAREEGAVSVLNSLMSVLDYFDMALRQDPETATARSVMDGVELIRHEVLKVFQDHGVSWIEPKRGDAFEPSRHEAIGHLPDPEIDPGHIVHVEQHGCLVGDRVLRPAKVFLAPEQSGGPAEEDAGPEDEAA